MAHIKYFLRTVYVSFIKELKIFVRYPYWLIVSLISPFLWVTMFMLFGAAFASGKDFVGFITIGMIGLLLADISLWGVGLGLRREQMRGTLLSLYATPASKVAVLLGSAMENFFELAVSSIIILGYASLAFNFTTYITDPIAVFLVVSFTIFALLGFGLLFAAVTMVVKEPNAIINVIQPILFIFAGIFFPISVLPPNARIISDLIPLTYAVIAMRKVFVYGYTTGMILNDIGILTIFGVVLNTLGILALRYIERRALKKGSLGKF